MRGFCESLLALGGTVLCLLSGDPLMFGLAFYPRHHRHHHQPPPKRSAVKGARASHHHHHHPGRPPILLFATSSRELKDQNKKEQKARKPRKKKSDTQTPKIKTSKGSSKKNTTSSEEKAATAASPQQQQQQQPSLRDRLHRATAKAKATALAAEYAAKRQQLEENGQEYQSTSNSKPSNSNQNNSTMDDNGDNTSSSSSSSKRLHSLGTLRQLTKIIDQELLSGRDGSKTFNAVQGTTNPPPGITRDSMRSLLEVNDKDGQQQHRDNDNNKLDQVKHVAVVFSKPLLQDQISLEYACRLRTLAKALQGPPPSENRDNNQINNDDDKDEEDGVYKPCVLCFVGERTSGNLVSDAEAGYLFFRHLCQANRISLDGIHIVLEETSLGKGALRNVMQHLKQDYIPEWLSASSQEESATDEYGEQRKQPRKKIQIHYTFFSSDYDLCRLNDIHHRSPQQSLLKPLQEKHEEEIAQSSSSYPSSPYASPAASPINLKGVPPAAVHGIVKCSWSYHYALYPYIHFHDKVTSFLGKCYLLAEELTPVLVNIRGVVDGTEFFQRDNYRVLVSIRRSFVTDMESFYKSEPSLKATLREYVINSDYPLDVVLEGVLLSLGRCLDLVRPAGLLIGYVPNTDWKNAEILLENVVRQMRDACDPDQPLDASEWGKLEYQFDHPVKKE